VKTLKNRKESDWHHCAACCAASL